MPLTKLWLAFHLLLPASQMHAPDSVVVPVSRLPDVDSALADVRGALEQGRPWQASRAKRALASFRRAGPTNGGGRCAADFLT